jgi:Rrf2 family protein
MALLSKKISYAIAAMYELAKSYHIGKLHLSTISDAQKIPKNFLVQVLLQLKQHDLVETIRGKEGGYRLKKSPQSTTIFDIISALTSFELIEYDGNCPILQKYWSEVEEKLIELFSQKTLADLTHDYEKLQGMISFQI